MKTHIIEVTNRGVNWGKFMLLVYDKEWEYESQMSPGQKLLHGIGKWRRSFWLFDLQTGEGVEFFPPAKDKAFTARFDLQKHPVWVCPMYEPFLTWLYANWDWDIEKLPSLLDLKDAPGDWRGYRRYGPMFVAIVEGLQHNLSGTWGPFPNEEIAHAWMLKKDMPRETYRLVLTNEPDLAMD